MMYETSSFQVLKDYRILIGTSSNLTKFLLSYFMQIDSYFISQKFLFYSTKNLISSHPILTNYEKLNTFKSLIFNYLILLSDTCVNLYYVDGYLFPIGKVRKENAWL